MSAKVMGRIVAVILIVLGVFFLVTKNDTKVLSFKDFKINNDITLTVINGGPAVSSSEVLYIPEGIELKKDSNIYSNTFLLKVQGIYYILGAYNPDTITKHLDVVKLSPSDIQGIILCDTKLDRIGGLLKDGKPLFENAILYINSTELDWIDGITEPIDVSQEELKPLKELQKQVLEAYSGHIKRVFYNGAPIIPEVIPMAQAGPTPGHTIYVLGSSNNRMVLTGSIIQNLNQIDHPEIYISSGESMDLLPSEATNSRKDIFDFLAADNIPFAGDKLPFPCVGKLNATEKGYEVSLEKQ